MKKCINNNKGFTLVELLAVMVILISISLVAVVSISSSLKKTEKKECEHQIELVINAAKIYFSLYGGNNVEVGTLIDNGYIDEDSVDLLDKEIVIDGSSNNYNLNGFDCN